MSELDHRTSIRNALKMVMDADEEAANLEKEWCEALFWQVLQGMVTREQQSATVRHDAQVHKSR